VRQLLSGLQVWHIIAAVGPTPNYFFGLEQLLSD